MLPICYLAGPFRSENPTQMAAHVLTAQQAAVDVARYGWAPYCPHAALGHAFGQIDEDTASAVNETFLSKAAAILLLPGWGNSEGARRELEHARRDGLIVFRSLAEVKAWLNR